jgi:hypothetical protein
MWREINSTVGEVVNSRVDGNEFKKSIKFKKVEID